MTIKEIQDEILRLKKEKDVCILAHTYQSQDILEIADFTGDSFGLSMQASKAPQKNVIMCGVRFMAETVKILSPDKRVWISHPEAGCPMAEQLDKESLLELRKQYSDHIVVAYVNTTADLKTACDVCVTSSSALNIVSKIDNDKILFIPDCNLGDYISKQLPEKSVKLIKGGCPTHFAMTEEDVKKARALHPGAKLLVHPECRPAVTALADFVGSTAAIIDYAKKSDEKEFIIGTENSIVQHLQFDCPDKFFYPLSKNCICENMKLTTLMEVLNCLNGKGGEEIELEPETLKKARHCIDEMLRLG